MSEEIPKGALSPEAIERSAASATATVAESTRFANLALGLDALVCNVTGLGFTLAGAFMANWLGVAGWLATLAGVVVLFWSFVVTLFANRRIARRREVLFVARVNFIFAVVAMALALTNWLEAPGRIVLVVAACAMAAFGVAQLTAGRRL